METVKESKKTSKFTKKKEKKELLEQQESRIKVKEKGTGMKGRDNYRLSEQNILFYIALRAWSKMKKN